METEEFNEIEESENTENLSDIEGNDTSINREENNVPVEENVVSPQKKKSLTQFPLARVKNIMKMDSDCNLVSHEAVCLMSKATELFIRRMAVECAKYTSSSKRKTVLKKDVTSAVDNSAQLCFLEGALE